jgi:hypothetical protein
MMLIRLAVISLFMYSTATLSGEQKVNLCKSSEKIIFSCSIAKKIVSLCSTPVLTINDKIWENLHDLGLPVTSTP